MSNAHPANHSTLPDCPRGTHPMVHRSPFIELAPGDASIGERNRQSWHGWYVLDITPIGFWALLG